jgi:hypothetical protein
VKEREKGARTLSEQERGCPGRPAKGKAETNLLKAVRESTKKTELKYRR